MAEISFRQLIRVFIAVGILVSLAGIAWGQSISIRPNRLREGDGKTRNVTLEADVARLSISVSYSSDPGTPSIGFIPKFVVQDNGSEDRDSEAGKIRVVLPRAFEKTGVYLIEFDETRSVIRLLHEPNTSSYFRQFVDWLVAAAGDGTRRVDLEPKSARERIEESISGGEPSKLAIWTAPMPAVGQEIDEKSPQLRIRSAVMPAWSRNRNYLACSTWQSGKWIIAAYDIRKTGDASPLWQWNPRNHKSNDFSPVWSPGGDAVAFTRLNKDQRSDIWILQLDRNYRPKREVEVTKFGNVQAILGWEKDIGIVFETKREIQRGSSARQLWATKTTIDGTAGTVRPTPLPDAYNLLRGNAVRRGTLIYALENDAPPPRSMVYEMNSSGSRPLLRGGAFCLHQWPTVSQDESWLAFESDCPVNP